MLFSMKKQGITKVVLLFVIIGLFVASTVLAANFGLDDTAGKANYDVSGKTNIYSLVGTIIQGFLAALSILFFFLLVYAGLLWMKARGNEQMVTEAKEMIMEAVFGLVIVMSAYGVTSFVILQLNR
ncbi:MAG: hypothetical protein AAB467_03575 [Patescibacteria group bacterium]